jgi:coenzyme F420 hydrogenase subunit delta
MPENAPQGENLKARSLERDPAEERPEIRDFENYETLVIGCGNVMLGDDGAGPAAVKLLETEGGLPESVGLLDAGTGIRLMLFNMLLSEKQPKKIIVLDAVDVGRKPGEVFEIDLGNCATIAASK